MNTLAPIFNWIFFILAGIEEMHESLDEFEFQQICNRVTCNIRCNVATLRSFIISWLPSYVLLIPVDRRDIKRITNTIV